MNTTTQYVKWAECYCALDKSLLYSNSTGIEHASKKSGSALSQSNLSFFEGAATSIHLGVAAATSKEEADRGSPTKEVGNSEVVPEGKQVQQK